MRCALSKEPEKDNYHNSKHSLKLYKEDKSCLLWHDVVSMKNAFNNISNSVLDGKKYILIVILA